MRFLGFSINFHWDNIITILAGALLVYGCWQVLLFLQGNIPWSADLIYPLLFSLLALKRNRILR